jgi:hypothetical protein
MHDLYEYETKGKAKNTIDEKGGICKWEKNKDSLTR